MATSGNVVSGVVGRYATAYFELADEAGALDQTAADVTALQAALEESPELRAALSNPAVSRAELGKVASALASRMGLSDLTGKLLGLMAANRRLSALPKTLEAFQALVAEKRGETIVEVRSASALSDAQGAALRDSLAKALGKTVHMQSTVDPELIGGLVVKMGSRMIDASIRSKLARLQTIMKEVG